MNSQEVIGYVVHNSESGYHVNTDSMGNNFVTDEEPLPIAIGDAYRRLGAWLDKHPDEEVFSWTVEPVYRTFTPIETASKELGALLSSLCGRHGVTLNMTQDQIEAKLAQELVSLGASH